MKQKLEKMQGETDPNMSRTATSQSKIGQVDKTINKDINT